MSTDRLYYSDAYLRRFTASVVAREDAGRRAYLDRTAFYPTSGGQPNDLGTLAGIRVLDVVDEGERIAHLLAGPLAADSVAGEIDWARRFDLMQQHTAQHLLSAVLADRFGYHTTSVHFGDQSATLDLEASGLTGEEAEQAEQQANALITENRPVEVSFEDAATVGGLRKASERGGTLRVVTIAGLDRSACGGTHVRATGEIGALLLGKVERVKKQVRIEFLAGTRAIRRARADADLLRGLAATCSAGPEELPAIIEARGQQLREAETDRRALTEQLAGYRVRAAYDATSSGADGVRWISMELKEVSGGDALRALGQAATALPGAVLVATLASPPTVLLAAAADSGVDAAALLKPALVSAGGKGGGSARLAQGTVPSLQVLQELVGRLRSR